MTAGRDGDDRGLVPRVSRREVLTSIGGTAAVTTLSVGDVTARAGPLQVRVHPGPVPLRAWMRYGFDGMRENWPPPYRDATAAVGDALEQVLSYARERSRLADVDLRVDRGELIRYPLSAASPSLESVVPSRETVLDIAREQIRDRGDGSATTCHLLLCWAPFNYRLGYGGTHPEVDRFGAVDGEGAYTVANIGATAFWDSPAVTRNMAIHETLHTFVSPDVAEAVGGSPCDHELGTAERVDDDTLRVSPLATAYAGPDRRGAGTRWPGRGCGDHDRFYRHDGLGGIDRYEYTTTVSTATCEAVTRYLESLSRGA